MTPGDRHLRTFGWTLHLAGFAVCTAVVAASHFFLLDPPRQEARALADQIRAREEFLEGSHRIDFDFESLKTKLERHEELRRHVVERIPATRREAEFLAQVAEVAHDASVAIRDYRPGGEVESDEYRELEIRLSASAGYEGLCRFLDGLQQLPRLCRVTALDVNVSDGDVTQYPINMTLRIYFAPAESKTVALLEKDND